MRWQRRDPAARADARPVSPRALVVAFVVVNALAFVLVRPGVPDLWAARARASAVSDGVGITYWFSWFGGSTPGGYSVLTPGLCALVGTEVLAALAAVAISAMVTVLVRGTHRPTTAAWVAAIGIVLNLWCGRVPFLLGSAFAVGAVLLVQRRRKLPAATLAVLTVLASPVAGVFLALALSGTLIAPAMRVYRGTVLITIAGAVGCLGAVGLLFGSPGPEPFPLYLLAEVGLALLLMLLLTPRRHGVRATLVISGLAALVVFVVPNGLGANFVRLALFCLPAVAVALSHQRLRTVIVLTTPILVCGGLTSVSAAESAADASSYAAYYASLTAEIDTLPGMADHRLELVHVSHAAYGALLGHAALARGWETQDDRRLNAVLAHGPLDAGGYRTWLSTNAVGYVAVDGTGHTAEARLIRTGHLDFLREVWSHGPWRLYEVRQPTPIVDPPSVLDSSSQAAMRVRVPCACRTLIRIRWSRFLTVAATSSPTGTTAPGSHTDAATLTADDSGWTILTTDRPGGYVLKGAL